MQRRCRLWTSSPQAGRRATLGESALAMMRDSLSSSACFIVAMISLQSMEAMQTRRPSAFYSAPYYTSVGRSVTRGLSQRGTAWVFGRANRGDGSGGRYAPGYCLEGPAKRRTK